MTHVFDLRKNRHVPIQETQQSNVKCTNLAINQFQPILLVGDTQGGVITYKISKQVVDPDVDLTDDKYIQDQIKEIKDCIKKGSMVD